MVPAIQTNKWRVFWKVNDVMKSSMADLWFVYILSSHYLWKQISIQFNIFFLKENHVSIGLSCHHAVRKKLHNQIVCRSRRKLIGNACRCIPSLVRFRVFLYHWELNDYTNHAMAKKHFSPRLQGWRELWFWAGLKQGSNRNRKAALNILNTKNHWKKQLNL